MRFPVPQITTLLLLAHLGLGCCWHHARACGTRVCDTAAYCDSVADAHRHDAEDDPHQQHEDSDRNPHRCDGVHCVFVRIGHAPELDGAASMAVSLWVTTASGHEYGQTDPLLRRRLGHFLSDARPPLRVHLVNQILLI